MAEPIEMLGAKLTFIGAQSGERGKSALEELAKQMETQMKSNASGRPGPNIITGTLNNSITHEASDGGYTQKIGPGPGGFYGEYLEKGKMGKKYRNGGGPKYPFVKPAFDAVVSKATQVFVSYFRGGW